MQSNTHSTKAQGTTARKTPLVLQLSIADPASVALLYPNRVAWHSNAEDMELWRELLADAAVQVQAAGTLAERFVGVRLAFAAGSAMAFCTALRLPGERVDTRAPLLVLCSDLSAACCEQRRRHGKLAVAGERGRTVVNKQRAQVTGVCAPAEPLETR